MTLGASRWRSTAAAALLAGAIGCAAATVAGFFGGLWWVFDLFAHFRVQNLVAAGVCAGLLALLRRWRWMLVPLGTFAVNAATVAPLFAGGAAAGRRAEAVRLVSFNVHRANTRHDDIARYLRDADADVFAVLELTPAALAALEARFPGHARVAEPRADSFGIALFSRLPLRSHEILRLGPSALPAIAVSFERAGERYATTASTARAWSRSSATSAPSSARTTGRCT